MESNVRKDVVLMFRPYGHEAYNAMCPNCGEIIGQKAYRTAVRDKMYSKGIGTCRYCGQLLDWKIVFKGEDDEN